MKKFILVAIMILCVVFLNSCGSESYESPSNAATSTYSSTDKSSGSNKSNNVGSVSGGQSSSSAICAHSGCTNKVASGDTVYCSAHSNKCLNCGKYIDEDALYCMSCLKESISSKSSDKKYSDSYGSSYSNDKKGYYGTDGYYNPTDEELEQAIKDAENWLKDNY